MLSRIKIRLSVFRCERKVAEKFKNNLMRDHVISLEENLN
jgi:hypothetical protein